MRLILTRHGETEENKEGIIQGHLPGTLSEKGKDQARKLALRLREEEIDVIYSSDLSRSANTAKEIAKFHPDIPFVFEEELREINLGEFQGMKRSEVYSQKKINTEPKEGESKEDVYKRAQNFLHKMISRHKNENVLLVGHGGINKALTGVITGKKSDELDKQSNAGVGIFEIDEDKNHKVVCFNCVKHLE